MNICEDCKSMIFCPSWGEYKCEVKQTRIYHERRTCADYVKATKKEERKCHCLTCMAEGYVDDEH